MPLNGIFTLDREGKSRGILLVLGLPKTGKDWVMRYWRNREHWDETKRKAEEMPPIVSLEVWKSQTNSLGQKVYVTPITCVTFSELVYGLAEVNTKYTPTYTGRQWYKQPKSLYTDPQFASLLIFVRKEVQRLRVRVIVINNAHYIDGNTLEMLMLLRRHCNNQVAFVLVAQMAENADMDEPLAEAFRQVSEAADICRKVVLQRLTKKEYKQTVLRGLTEDLNLSFADDLLDEAIAKAVPNALWHHTRFDWKCIDDLARVIKAKAPEPRNGRPRVLTRAVLEKILGKPLLIKSPSQEADGDGIPTQEANSEPPVQENEDIPF